VSDEAKAAAALATVAFVVGAFFRFHWDAALMMTAGWTVILMVLFGSDGADE
jgi:hypothetical protein